MTTPPPPPGAPFHPQAYGAAPARLRGRTPLRVGLILVLVGLALSIAGAFVVAKKSLSVVNGFDRVKVSAGPASGTVTFDRTGNYVAYYEASDIDSNTDSVPAVGVALKSPSGEVRALRTPYGGRSDHKVKILTYEFGGHHGIALWQFKITEKGTYQVEVIGNPDVAPDAEIAFGKSIAGGLAVGAALLVLGILLLIAGIVLLIVGGVKRHRHKKKLAVGGFGGPPPNYPYPPQPYPPQPHQPPPGAWPAAPGQ